EDGAIKAGLARRRPYGRWLRERRVAGTCGAPVEPPGDDLVPRQLLHGWTREDVLAYLRPMASTGHEPTSSMGDDAAIAPLANRPRPLSSYFRQRFAQVTNPPIDHIRERSAMSIETLLGARAPRSWSRAASRAACTTSPVCSATAPRRSAPRSRSRRLPRWRRATSSAATTPRPRRRRPATGGRWRRAC